MFCKSRHDRELLFRPDVDNHVPKERFSMTSNAANDQIVRKNGINDIWVKKALYGLSCLRRSDHLWCRRFRYLRDHERLQCFRRVTANGPFQAGDWQEAVNVFRCAASWLAAVKNAR
jgi:hypothetical protein